MNNHGDLLIDGWQIDAESHRIMRDGVEVRLEPRSMELLLYLARRPDRVVSRKEIEDSVWGDRVVGYEALSGAIGKLRKAFGDTNKDHHVIETVSKAGYRLVAPVLPQKSRPDSFASHPVKTSRPGVWVIAAAALFAVITTAPKLQFGWPATALDNDTSTQLSLPDKPSIAVLPFVDMSGERNQGYFADGMTEDLTTDLARLSGMFVIAGNSVDQFKNKPLNIRQIAAELGVRYVLKGSVRVAGGQLRVNAWLIEAATGGHLWAQRYDGELYDVFSLQDKITRKIVKALEVELTPAEEVRQAQKNTNNLQAYEAFHQASQLRPFESAGEFAKTVGLFERALELDPAYGDVHAALANLYYLVDTDGWHHVVGVSYAQATTGLYYHANKAMENPTAAAHRVRAIIRARQGLWDDAIDEALMAIKLNPNDAHSLITMSNLLIKMGRLTEAQVYFNESMRLDPEKKDCFWIPASITFHLEQYDQAVEQLLTFIEDDPNNEWLHLLLAASYGHLQMIAEGSAAIRRFNELRAKKDHRGIYTASRLSGWKFQDESVRQRIRDGLLKAGMPEY